MPYSLTHSFAKIRKKKIVSNPFNLGLWSIYGISLQPTGNKLRMKFSKAPADFDIIKSISLDLHVFMKRSMVYLYENSSFYMIQSSIIVGSGACLDP